MTENNRVRRFPGFHRTYHRDYFTYPMVLEEYWHDLSGSEQKVLDFILRQTIGFRKTSDCISFNQFSNGLGRRNRGTGLSRSQVRRAMTSLEEQGFIRIVRVQGRPCTFNLVLDESEIFKPKGFEAFTRG